jgi:hypothetical protein
VSCLVVVAYPLERERERNLEKSQGIWTERLLYTCLDDMMILALVFVFSGKLVRCESVLPPSGSSEAVAIPCDWIGMRTSKSRSLQGTVPHPFSICNNIPAKPRLRSSKILQEYA